MIFDKTLQFSDAQAITATAISTNIVDTLATGTVYGAAAALSKDIGKGNKIPVLIQVVEAFNTLTSLTVDIRFSAAEGMGSPKIVQSQTIPLAELVAGKTISIDCVPPGADLRYMAVNYTVTGTNPTTGRMTAGIVAAVQTNGADF